MRICQKKPNGVILPLLMILIFGKDASLKFDIMWTGSHELPLDEGKVTPKIFCKWTKQG